MGKAYREKRKSDKEYARRYPCYWSYKELNELCKTQSKRSVWACFRRRIKTRLSIEIEIVAVAVEKARREIQEEEDRIVFEAMDICIEKDYELIKKEMPSTLNCS